jgi:hypothetical protein
MIQRINPPLVVSAGASSQSYGTVQFANSNGVSFGLSNGVFTASAVGGGGGAAITLSDPATSLVASQIAFTNLNGLTMGLSTTTGGKATVTASYTVPSIVGLISAINVSAGANSSNVSAVVFSNANGVSFGLNGQTVTASHNGLTSQSNQAFSAGGGSSAFQTLGFSDMNGVSFTNTNGSVGVTHDLQYTSNTSNITSNALNTSAARVVNVVAATNNTGGGAASLSSNVSFSNANGATFYTSAGNVVALSYTVPAIPAATSWTVSDAATSATVGRLAFGNANGLTFGLSTSNNGNHTVTASYTVPPSFSAGVSNIGNSSGNTGVTGTRVVFAGGNNITVSQGTDANGATITISGANVGGAQTGISGIANSETTYTSGSVTFSALGALTIRSSSSSRSTHKRIRAPSKDSAFRTPDRRPATQDSRRESTGSSPGRNRSLFLKALP